MDDESISYEEQSGKDAADERAKRKAPEFARSLRRTRARTSAWRLRAHRIALVEGSPT